MPFTRGARVPEPESEATKTDQPPSLPDTSGWVRRRPGDVIEAGTPYASFGQSGYEWEVGTQGAGDQFTILTPPPAPVAPWSVLSTDHRYPTLAKLTFTMGTDWTGNVHRDDEWVREESGDIIARLDAVTHVELLHTHNPETHVPVERALIERLLNLPGGSDSLQFRDELASVRACLAALADGVES